MHDIAKHDTRHRHVGNLMFVAHCNTKSTTKQQINELRRNRLYLLTVYLKWTQLDALVVVAYFFKFKSILKDIVITLTKQFFCFF